MEKFKISALENLKLKDINTGQKTYLRDYYSEIKYIGAGSFGFVVAAKDLSNNQEVALKVSLKLIIFTFWRLLVSNLRVILLLNLKKKLK